MLLNYGAGEGSWESPGLSKEIKPVNPKGNQPWIFIGRTDAEAPIPWSTDAKSWFIGKDPDARKEWRQEEKGPTGWDGWMASPTQWTWVWANSRKWWRTGKAWVLHLWVHKELDTTERLNNNRPRYLGYCSLGVPNFGTVEILGQVVVGVYCVL